MYIMSKSFSKDIEALDYVDKTLIVLFATTSPVCWSRTELY